jgi:hypothetical protein
MIPWLSKNVTNITLFFDFWNRFLLCLGDRYNRVKNETLNIQRSSKHLTGSQFERFLLIGQTMPNKPSSDLPFSEIFHWDSVNCFPATFEFLFHHPKNYSTIVETNCRAVSIISGVRKAAGRPLCSSTSRFSRTSRNVAYHTKTCVQDLPSIATISTFYPLESFGSCSVSLETKLNVLRNVTTICRVQNLEQD